LVEIVGVDARGVRTGGSGMSDGTVTPIAAAKGPKKAKPYVDAATDDWRAKLVYSEAGKIKKLTHNVIEIISHDDELGGMLEWDEFRQLIVTTQRPPWRTDGDPAWAEEDTIQLVAWFNRRYQLDVGKETVMDAVRVVARRTTTNEVRDYFEALRWDGKRRVNTWPIVYLGAADSEYVRSVGIMWINSGVARTYEPGCQADHVMVMEGAQGLGKSSALGALAGDWYTDTPLDLNSKDAFIGLQGNLIVEFSELEGLSRQDVGRIKNFISSRSDSYRPPFAKSNVKVPRRCIFAGTTNNQAYLRDETGNRRFWGLECRKIDLEALKRDRDQLWAEAREMYLQKTPWWPNSVELARLCEDAQAERTTQDAWLDIIAAYLDKQQKAGAFVTVGDVLGEALDIKKADWTQPDQNRVARCFLQLKWEPTQRRRKDENDRSIRPHGYVPPGTKASQATADRVTDRVTEVGQ
jgi:putative DNA primase/helicase